MGIQLCILQWVDSTSKMKLLVLSSIVVVGLCAPDAEADADAFYGQYQWPATFGLGPYGGFSSTCYGCRPYGHFLGKRSADADPHFGGYGYRRLGYGYPYAFGYRRGFYGKRSAEAETAPEVSAYGKRSAAAEPHGVAGHVHGLGLGVAGHPGYGTSYVGRTVYGYPSLRYGKRSADADAHYRAYGYGRYSYGSPYGYGYMRAHFYGKRSADADAYYRSYGYGRYAYGSPYGYG